MRDGAEIAPRDLAPKRTDYCQIVLEQRLRYALSQLNPGLPAEALEDTFR